MNKHTRIALSTLLCSSALLISACSSTAPTTTKQAGTVSKESVVIVRQGTVTAIKDVSIQGRSGRAAGTVGSIAGSLLGSTVPVAGSLIGSMIGGAVGSEADKNLSKQKGYEISLLLSNGEKVTVTQLADTAFKVGDKINLTMQDNKARVSHLQDNS